jgi:hypothetical protein
LPGVILLVHKGFLGVAPEPLMFNQPFFHFFVTFTKEKNEYG